MSDLMRTLAAIGRQSRPQFDPPPMTRLPDEDRQAAEAAYRPRPQFEVPSQPEPMGDYAEQVAPADAMNMPIESYQDPFSGRSIYKAIKQQPAPAPYVGQYRGRH